MNPKLKPGALIYLRDPGVAAKRVLHRTLLVGSSDDGCTVSIERPEIEFSEDLELLAYFDGPTEFMVQSVRIESVEQEDDAHVIGLAAVSDAISAEKRECYRVSTLTSRARVRLGSEANCVLRDTSLTGLSVIARTGYHVGQLVPVELDYDDSTYRGMTSVQSIRRLPAARFRYGLHCLDPDRREDSLDTGLSALTHAVQQAQQRRMRGGF